MVLLLTMFGSARAMGEVVFNTQVGEEIRHLDPQKATELGSAHITINMFMGLYEYDHKTGEPVPMMATSYTRNADSTQYTFKLRNDFSWVKLENGKVVKQRPVTADDFVYSFRRMLSPELASEYAYMLYIVKNGEKFNKGEIKNVAQVGVKALDANTLQITLEGPSPTFIKYLPHHSFHVVPKEPIEKFGEKWIENQNIWTNGPFALKEWKLKERISLVKNPYFPDAKDIQIDTVNFRFIGTSSPQSVRAFRAGELDVDFSSPPANDLASLQKEKKLVISKQLGTYFVRLNVTKKPLDNVKVRKALALTIPREEIVKYVMKGGQIPTYSFVPDAFGGYEPAAFDNADKAQKDRINEAKKLMAEAGFPGGKGFPELSYVYNTSDMHKNIAVVIVKAWKEALGVNIKPLNEEWKVFLQKQANLDYEIQRSGWIADMEDPLNFAEMFISGGGNNNTGFTNKAYDELIKAARIEADAAKRNKMLADAEAILMKELPVLPVFNYVSINLKQPYVQGFFANKFDQHPLRFVKIDEKMRQKMYPASH
jgi:oligopeptide transport system substrate-binding protein